ncbi:MAG: peptidoglycan DD-metalloendopeptidase family protein [Lachnospiraceae bacterium]|nr:peptidoglycan DD-metalloendopeptidase family protein [Lachnospiraceae bacterium]
MRCKKHRRKDNHVIIVTSEAVDASVKQIRIRPWIMKCMILVLCLVIGGMLGYIYYEQQIWKAVSGKYEALQQELKVYENQIVDLQAQVEARNTKINDLNNTITVLSETVNKKTETENQLMAAIEQQSTPTEFPLNSSATMEEVQGNEPSCLFQASEGSMIIATANGTVVAVNEDALYGHNVWVDHGNGYITIYRNQGEPMVEQGELVSKGTTLYLVGEKNTTFCYQMMKDGSYISPVDMLTING